MLIYRLGEKFTFWILKFKKIKINDRYLPAYFYYVVFLDQVSKNRTSKFKSMGL